MARAATWTISLSSGCGAASNTRRSTSTRMPASPKRRPASAPGSASITRSASTRACAIARRAKSTKQNADGYMDDRLRRPAAPSPTSPPAQPPTTGLMLTRGTAEAMPSPSRRARSEPIPKSAGLHLRRRLRLSHDRGPPQLTEVIDCPTRFGRRHEHLEIGTGYFDLLQDGFALVGTG